MGDFEEDDIYDAHFQSQLEAITKSELEERQQSQHLQYYESEALARALACSEQEVFDTCHHSTMRPNPQPTSVAHRADSEVVAMDEDEYATALNKSIQDYEAEQQSGFMEMYVLQEKQQRSEEWNQGSWDCPQCTFTNPPYTARQCQMCRAPALPNVLTFSKVPNLRFGLEIEMIVPDGKRDGLTLDTIAVQLTRLGPPRVQFMGYSHETMEDWKIVTDRSLEGASHDLCFELVSPVLQGEAGVSALRVVLGNIRKMMGIRSNNTCGFHVHVDATRASNPQQAFPPMGELNGVKEMVKSFVALENAFDLIVTRSWDRSSNNGGDNRRTNLHQYCRSNRMHFGSMSNRQRWERIDAARNYTELVNLVNPNNDRYHKLNLTNILKHNRPSTCEFRQHGGVEELLEAEAWLRLILRFCERTSTNSGHVSLLLPESNSPTEELQALFRLLDCHGLSQFYMTEKRLYGNAQNRLRNDWQCQTCRKTFQTSRSLAQHQSSTGHH